LKINNNTESLHKHSNVFVRGVCGLSIFSGWIAAAMILAAVLITCQMLFVRSVLNESTIWQTEAVIYLMISATLLGLPYVQLLRGHVNVDLIPMLLSSFWRKWMYYLTLMISFGIVAVMAFYAYEHWHIAFERQWRSDTVWGIRLWIPYIALPIGFFLFCLQLLADFIAVCIGEDRPYGLEDK
jgi:TRAP-type C4-dicarboxylate transport system permease small subunit